jgi:hypothetical protein
MTHSGLSRSTPSYDRVFDKYLLVKPTKTKNALTVATCLTTLTFQLDPYNIRLALALLRQQLGLHPLLRTVKCIFLIKKPSDNIVLGHILTEMDNTVRVAGKETKGSRVNLRVGREPFLEAVEWTWELKGRKSVV